jgi:hypothetical protein
MSMRDGLEFLVYRFDCESRKTGPSMHGEETKK